MIREKLVFNVGIMLYVFLQKYWFTFFVLTTLHEYEFIRFSLQLRKSFTIFWSDANRKLFNTQRILYFRKKIINYTRKWRSESRICPSQYFYFDVLINFEVSCFGLCWIFIWNSFYLRCYFSFINLNIAYILKVNTKA